MRDDQLPKSGCYILNLDDSSGPGTHWVAVYNNEYFDSYGLNPPKKLSHLNVVNTIRHQKLENTCGIWCCLFLLLRNNGISAYKISYNLFKYSSN